MSPDREEAETLLRTAADDAASGIEFPWTHDLRFLLERLDAEQIEQPDWLAKVSELTPWAVEYRYGETVGGSLDRGAAAVLVADVVRWARACVQEAE